MGFFKKNCRFIRFGTDFFVTSLCLFLCIKIIFIFIRGRGVNVVRSPN
jgi:hypothetical protein